MPYISGWLVEGVDPGFGGGGGSGNRPDNSLPPGVPPIGSTLPEAPPGIWPPPSLGNPIVPIGPDNSLPVQPGTIWPSPGRPPHIDAGLPGSGGRPDQGLPPSPGRPDQGLPGAPARPDQGLPGGGGGRPDNTLPSKTYWMLCYCPSLGWRYVSVDPSLRPGHALPSPGHPSGQPVPPVPTPHK